MLRAIAALLIWSVVQCGTALAQDIPLWGYKVISQIYATQNNNGCYAELPSTPSVYLLGVIPSDTLLTEQARVELVSRLENILSAQSNFRFRSAGAFQPIAHSANSADESRRAELRKLVEGASNDDLTILLRPYAKRGPNVDIRVMFWARDGKGAARRLTCTPAITIAYKTGTTDSACNSAWSRARRKNTIAGYQGFLDYLGHCTEADEAHARIKELRQERDQTQAAAACKRNLATARKLNTSEAYEDYLKRNPECPNADIVYLRLDEIRKVEAQSKKEATCRASFNLARSKNTPEAFDAFLAANSTCSQRDAALGLRDALIVKRSADDALRKAQSSAANNSLRQNSKTRGTTSRSVNCNDLWYERNLIFHNRGYRFTTARGKRAFGTGGYTSNPKLSSSERRRVKQIKRLERLHGC